ncbi:unnamed protein product [Spirodela intermedia]|uniref:Uncharacterized protein n=2 Tax=Spirodela intermedia TaxID=51605 RepID=A0A7I8JI33_SPIIN|nr:unnamed protein product [Spirodela intermedia]CAA6669395.1 unnamed protein product [Spirodela intermedia]CAA7406348.1 unnamed protein product [Spirodela intermedia]
MFRSAVRRVATAAAAAAAAAGALSSPLESLSHRVSSVRPPAAAVIGALRSFGGSGLDDSQRQQQKQRQTAQQMIQYTLGLARSQKSADSYAQALLVLEQGLSNLHAGSGEGSDDAVGMLLIAMSTLLHERGEINDAMEKLQMIHQLEHCSPVTRVAAWEGLVGLNLELGEDDSSSILSDECLEVLRNNREEDAPMSNILYLRAKAIRGLVDMVRGDLQSGNLALSCGEFLHATGNVSLAKDFYERALQISEANGGIEFSSLAAANMVPNEVSLGATCALGQLLMHSRDFQGAEELLTKALNKAEDIFGSNHPKVGVVLTCIAMMFGQKAKMERSSSLLIQEGLYRRAIDYLKAPASINEDSNGQDQRRDIIALARGGYAEILCVQQSRKEEGERLRRLAESQWRNPRLSLGQALEISEPAKAAIVDTRISRIL